MSEPKSYRRAPATVSESLPSDGRRRRTHDSQRRIVDALLSLVEDGHASPSAELVAERAGVGLRSVFRHFSDMDNLYREITLILAARLEEVARRPFKAADWQGKLLEMVERRADAYERMAPFLAAAKQRRLVVQRCSGCGQLRKRGGEHKYRQGSYKTHGSLAQAVDYANSTRLPVINCSFCRPDTFEDERQ